MSEIQSSLRIAIDLTPLRVGGANGGAKVLILTLIKQFQKLAPHHHFVLLTAPWNHSEIKEYETHNTECLLIPNLTETPKQPKARLLSKLIQKIRNKISIKLIDSLNQSTLLTKHNINLLFALSLHQLMLKRVYQ